MGDIGEILIMAMGAGVVAMIAYDGYRKFQVAKALNGTQDPDKRIEEYQAKDYLLKSIIITGILIAIGVISFYNGKNAKTCRAFMERNNICLSEDIYCKNPNSVFREDDPMLFTAKLNGCRISPFIEHKYAKAFDISPPTTRMKPLFVIGTLIGVLIYFATRYLYPHNFNRPKA